jgi:hypothetical protein
VNRRPPARPAAYRKKPASSAPFLCQKCGFTEKLQDIGRFSRKEAKRAEAEGRFVHKLLVIKVVSESGE